MRRFRNQLRQSASVSAAKIRQRKRVCGFVLAIVIACLAANPGCNNNVTELNSSPAAAADCLPQLVLTDQHDHPVSLAALKGQPVLFDFIYTTCPGPCLLLTARMKAIADQLGPALGAKVRLVSITVDPEHDAPSVLKAYAGEQGAERPGWLFLTGKPSAIDELMARFNLRRQRESGEVEHVLEFFLVGADGHQIVQYLAADANPAKVAGDLQEVAAGRRLAAAIRKAMRLA